MRKDYDFNFLKYETWLWGGGCGGIQRACENMQVNVCEFEGGGYRIAEYRPPFMTYACVTWRQHCKEIGTHFPWILSVGAKHCAGCAGLCGKHIEWLERILGISVIMHSVGLHTWWEYYDASRVKWSDIYHEPMGRSLWSLLCVHRLFVLSIRCNQVWEVLLLLCQQGLLRGLAPE